MSAVVRTASRVLGNSRAISSSQTARALSTFSLDGLSHKRGDSAGTFKGDPLVIIIGWMGSKERHLSKYEQLYHERGFDSLLLKPRAKDVLVPRNAEDRMRGLVDSLDSHQELKDRPVVFHCFSTGGYMYGQLLRVLNDIAESDGDHTRDAVVDRFHGQVFDSPVDYEEIPHGMPKALYPNDRMRQKIGTALISSFLNTFDTSIGSQLRSASSHFHDNYIPCPALWYYSHDDDVAPRGRIEEVMAKWRAKGIPVHSQAWESSRHVTHLRNNRDDYVGALDKYLHDHTELCK